MTTAPRRVVLVGHGMVGHRFCEEIRRRDPRGTRIELTVLAAEPRTAYNRILLPSVLAGVMRDEELSLGEIPGVTVRTATEVVALDREGRTVLTSDGRAVPYDDLVFATGAVARVPCFPGVLRTRGDGPPSTPRMGGPVPPCPPGGGQAPALDRSVTALRSVADARRLTAIANQARRKHGRVVVLGGGVLGLEAARALAARGTAVTVVHRGTHLMERQLDPAAGRVLAVALARTGVDIELGAAASWWEPGQGLWLTDGRLIRATGMLLSTGAAPDAGLARDSGLKLTESGAIAVDDALTTSDPRVHAIGDCAGHPGAPGGLVQPGWEQAAVLASRLTGADPRARYRGSTVLTRLKAAGIELTCVGDSLATADPGAPKAPAGGPEASPRGFGGRGAPQAGIRKGAEPLWEVLTFEDPCRERYAKLVIADDRIAGAIMIGLPDAAAGITQLYDRGAPAPADRLALLLGRALPPEADGSGPGALPDHAIVCRCNMVTKSALRDAWYRGATCARDLSASTRAATGCGTCADDVAAFATWLNAVFPTTGDPSPETDPTDKEPALS